MNLPRTVTALAATALIALLSFASAAPALASLLPCRATGTGATLAAAELQASDEMHSSYYGCEMPYELKGDGQYADGTWWATLFAYCTGDI
jgi:hypothetical protein